MKKNIKVLLVDDHALVRKGLKSLLSRETDITIINEAPCGETALTLIRANKPDVVLMDIKMPGIGGLETTKRMLRLFPDIRIIVVTACSNDPYPTKLIQTGALGFLAKECSAEELIDAIRRVAGGQRYVSAKIAQDLALRNASQTPRQLKNNDSSPVAALSDREIQVLIMLSKGLTIQYIAQKLSVAAKTINTYRYRLYHKLNVKTDVALAHFALQQGLINLEDSNHSENLAL